MRLLRSQSRSISRVHIFVVFCAFVVQFISEQTTALTLEDRSRVSIRVSDSSVYAFFRGEIALLGETPSWESNTLQLNFHADHFNQASIFNYESAPLFCKADRCRGKNELGRLRLKRIAGEGRWFFKLRLRKFPANLQYSGDSLGQISAGLDICSEALAECQSACFSFDIDSSPTKLRLTHPKLVICAPELGNKKTVVIISTFDSPFGYPWEDDLQLAQNMFFQGPTSLAAYLAESSYGKVSLQGEVYGFYILPGGYEDYCNGGGSCDLDRLQLHSIAVADGDIDYSQVERIILIVGGAHFEKAFATLEKRTVPTQEGPIETHVIWFDRSGLMVPEAVQHEYLHTLGGKHIAAVENGGSLDAEEAGEVFRAPEATS